MSTIGARVRSLREHKQWSQEDLAGASDLQRPHISLIENNERTPGAESLTKLANALQTSTDYLLGLTDNPSPTPMANHPALRDPRFAYLADMWPLLPDYARIHFKQQVELMERLNPDLRRVMAERGLSLPDVD